MKDEDETFWGRLPRMIVASSQEGKRNPGLKVGNTSLGQLPKNNERKERRRTLASPSEGEL
jgi:hypothetical protein